MWFINVIYTYPPVSQYVEHQPNLYIIFLGFPHGSSTWFCGFTQHYDHWDNFPLHSLHCPHPDGPPLTQWLFDGSGGPHPPNFSALPHSQKWFKTRWICRKIVRKKDNKLWFLDFLAESLHWQILRCATQWQIVAGMDTAGPVPTWTVGWLKIDICSRLDIGLVEW